MNQELKTKFKLAYIALSNAYCAIDKAEDELYKARPYLWKEEAEGNFKPSELFSSLQENCENIDEKISQMLKSIDELININNL